MMRSKAAARGYTALLALDVNATTRDEFTRAGVPATTIDIFYPAAEGFGALLPHLIRHLDGVPARHLARADPHEMHAALIRISSARYGFVAKYNAVWQEDYVRIDEMSDYLRQRLEDELSIFLNYESMSNHAMTLVSACWWVYQAMADRNDLSFANKCAVDRLMLVVADVLQLH